MCHCQLCDSLRWTTRFKKKLSSSSFKRGKRRQLSNYFNWQSNKLTLECSTLKALTLEHSSVRDLTICPCLWPCMYLSKLCWEVVRMLIWELLKSLRLSDKYQCSEISENMWIRTAGYSLASFLVDFWTWTGQIFHIYLLQVFQDNPDNREYQVQGYKSTCFRSL